MNETASGTIVTTETWSGTHTLTGDVTVAEVRNLSYKLERQSTFHWVFIDVEGAICAGSASCGATQGSASSQVRFEWATPSDYSVTGMLPTGQPTLTNSDAACGSGIIIRSTINQASTGMSHVSFNNAYGYPIYVQTLQAVQYGTLVFDGSSAVVDNLAFSNINTSNIIAIDFAAPTIRDSTFTLGDDGRGYDAAAVRAYEAGAGILSALTITGSTFTGNTQGSVVIKAEDVSSSTPSRPMFQWTISTSRTTLTERSSRVRQDRSATVPSTFSATQLTPTPTRQQAISLTLFTSITTSLPLVRAQELLLTMALLLQRLTTPFPAHRVGPDLVSVIRRLVLIATPSVQSLVSMDSGSTVNPK